MGAAGQGTVAVSRVSTIECTVVLAVALLTLSHLKDLGDHASSLSSLSSSESLFACCNSSLAELTLPYARSFHAGRALATLGASIDLFLKPSTSFCPWCPCCCYRMPKSCSYWQKVDRARGLFTSTNFHATRSKDVQTWLSSG